MKKITLLILLSIVLEPLSGQNVFEFDGQATIQSHTSFKNNNSHYLGLRYLPEFKYILKIDSLKSFTIEGSGNLTISKYLNNNLAQNNNSTIRPYRIWSRFVHKTLELRLGLQKIDFGSAMLLRPLQWFNQIDPRDPLGLTNGVSGLLLRYYFKNNSNVWLWGLYGNKKPRGFDALPTYPYKPEFGGRFQKTIPKGEVAFSYNFRTSSYDENQFLNPFEQNPEHRIGVDAKWDIGIGFWTESSFIKRVKNIGAFTSQFLFEIGADYTFGIGNGLNIIGEHLITSYGESLIIKENASHISAFNLSYPISFYGAINAFLYHQWEERQNTFSLNYQHKFNRLSGHLIASYNPESPQGIQQNDILNTFTGASLKILLVYNH